MQQRKYSCIGNRIGEYHMEKLYRIKQARRIPITKLVAIAVKEFIERAEGGNNV